MVYYLFQIYFGMGQEKAKCLTEALGVRKLNFSSVSDRTLYFLATDSKPPCSNISNTFILQREMKKELDLKFVKAMDIHNLNVRP